MVVGHGMMAKVFAAFAGDPHVVIFASGVSNSLETDAAAFRREKELLLKTRAAHPDALVVYFGTCSVHDPDRRDTPYVRHKLEMEGLLARSTGPWLVLRLPLAIGPGHRGQTLAKYLHGRIVRGEAFEVWARSSRYALDVEDALRIATRLIADRSGWNRIVEIAFRAFPVLDFVKVLESITGKRANYALLDKGQQYLLQCPEADRLARELGIDVSEQYLERVLRKYFRRADPLISVVVSVFNGAATLQRCLDSVAAQTYPGRELIVIDAGSTDGTLDILKRNASRFAYWISEPDKGIYHAWNKALPHARGDWICFLGADDYFWSSEVLDRLSGVLATAWPRFRVVYGKVAVVTASCAEIVRLGEPWPSARARFRQMMSIPHPGLMHHRTLFTDHGSFDESFRVAGDYEFLLRELATNDALFVPDVVVAGVMQGGVSATPQGRLQALRECREAQHRHAAGRPGARWIWEMAKTRILVGLWRVLGEKAGAQVFDTLRVLAGKPRYWTRQ